MFEHGTGFLGKINRFLVKKDITVLKSGEFLKSYLINFYEENNQYASNAVKSL